MGKAGDAVSVSFDRFCLTAGIEALGTIRCVAPEAAPDRLGERLRAVDRCGHERSQETLSQAQSLLPALRLALAAHYEKETNNRAPTKHGAIPASAVTSRERALTLAEMRGIKEHQLAVRYGMARRDLASSDTSKRT